MKKNIVALAVAAAISAPVAMADAPTVYGKLNVNAAWANGADMNINDTASRLGVKGSEDLGNGLKAVYKIEFDVDLAGAGTLKGRNQYAGLAGGFGTVLLGRHDTPEKMSQPSDLFNDGAADYSKMSRTSLNETRASDVIAYVSPSFSGVKLMAAQVANGTNSQGAFSAAITYGSKKKGIYLAAGMHDDKDNSSQDTTRLSAQYKANGLTANVIFTDTTSAGTQGTNTQINLGYKMGKFQPKVKAGMTDPKAAGASTTDLAYGLDYKLGKKTTAYIEILDKDKTNAGDVTTVGMIHKF